MAVPFDERPDLIWFDGRLISTADSKISVLTHGLHYASCVFEGERAYGGRIFESTAHSERLKNSAKILLRHGGFSHFLANAIREFLKNGPVHVTDMRNASGVPGASAMASTSPTMIR